MKKQGIAILLVLLFMLWDGISFAEEDRITPFYYSFATPTADDLSKDCLLYTSPSPRDTR